MLLTWRISKVIEIIRTDSWQNDTLANRPGTLANWQLAKRHVGETTVIHSGHHVGRHLVSVIVIKIRISITISNIFLVLNFFFSQPKANFWLETIDWLHFQFLDNFQGRTLEFFLNLKSYDIQTFAFNPGATKVISNLLPISDCVLYKLKMIALSSILLLLHTKIPSSTRKSWTETKIADTSSSLLCGLPTTAIW